MKNKVKDNRERAAAPEENSSAENVCAENGGSGGTGNANADILAKLNDGSIGAVDDVQLKGVDGKKIINILFTVVSIGIVLYTLYIGLFGMPTVMVHRISHVCVILFAAPMVYPSKIFKQGTKAELIFNIFCTVVGVAAALYALANWMKFFSYSLTTMDIVMLTILVIAVLESTRRAIGIPMVIIAFVAIAYCLIGPYLPGALAHKGYEFSRIINMICVGTEGLFSSTLGTASVEIAAFLIFSALLQASGALQYFMRLAFSVAGGYTGGPAKVAVISSAMMGTVSGSTVANVTATGSITIPLMKMMGFKPVYAGSVEAVSSAGGSITPPVLGATAFLIAEFLDMSYWSVAVAAIIPAILYYISLFNSVHVRSMKDGLLGLPKDSLPNKRKSLQDAIFLILPIVILIVLMAMQFSALMAAIYSTLALLIVTNFKKDTRLNLQILRKTCRMALKSMLSVSAACASAGVIIATLSMTGLGQKVGALITEFSGGNLVVALILTQLAALLLGTGLVTPATYTLLGVLCAPALIELGAEPIAAHLFIFHFAILGTLTPPVSLAAFAAAGIAGSNPMKTGIAALKLALPGFLIPYFFVINPTLVGQGEFVEIAIDMVTAVIGVFFMDYAIEGFIKRKLNIAVRFMCGAAGILLIYPSYSISLIGLALAIAVIVMERIGRKKDGGAAKNKAA